MDTPTTVCLLVDNHAGEGLVAEHGFAVWISTGQEHILFDTGAGAALTSNARSLGIDLSATDRIVLSHGHYDHSGALAEVLSMSPRAKVTFVHGANRARFSCHPDTAPRAIGMAEHDLAAMRSLPPEQCHELFSPYRMTPAIGISGPVPRRDPLEDSGGPFYFDAQRSQADPIHDDQSMWFETPQGLIILTGCCHAGLINTVEYLRQTTGIQRIHGIIGGFHLLHASPGRMRRTLEALQKWHPDFVVACHCTGDAAAATMQERLGKAVVSAGCSGMRFEFLLTQT